MGDNQGSVHFAYGHDKLSFRFPVEGPTAWLYRGRPQNTQFRHCLLQRKPIELMSICQPTRFANWGRYEPNLHVWPGSFEKTLSYFTKCNSVRVALLRLDNKIKAVGVSQEVKLLHLPNFTQEMDSLWPRRLISHLGLPNAHRFMNLSAPPVTRTAALSPKSKQLTFRPWASIS